MIRTFWNWQNYQGDRNQSVFSVGHSQLQDMFSTVTGMQTPQVYPFCKTHQAPCSDLCVLNYILKKPRKPFKVLARNAKQEKQNKTSRPKSIEWELEVCSSNVGAWGLCVWKPARLWSRGVYTVHLRHFGVKTRQQSIGTLVRIVTYIWGTVNYKSQFQMDLAWVPVVAPQSFRVPMAATHGCVCDSKLGWRLQLLTHTCFVVGVKPHPQLRTTLLQQKQKSYRIHPFRVLLAVLL